VNVKKVIGQKTRQLCQSVIHVIRNFATGNQNPAIISRLIIFWIEEYVNVPNWSQDPRSWYCLNEICNLSLSLDVFEPISQHIQKLEELK
jgi:hypothetical protein